MELNSDSVMENPIQRIPVVMMVFTNQDQQFKAFYGKPHSDHVTQLRVSGRGLLSKEDLISFVTSTPTILINSRITDSLGLPAPAVTIPKMVCNEISFENIQSSLPSILLAKNGADFGTYGTNHVGNKLLYLAYFDHYDKLKVVDQKRIELTINNMTLHQIRRSGGMIISEEVVSIYGTKVFYFEGAKAWFGSLYFKGVGKAVIHSNCNHSVPGSATGQGIVRAVKTINVSDEDLVRRFENLKGSNNNVKEENFNPDYELVQNHDSDSDDEDDVTIITDDNVLYEVMRRNAPSGPFKPGRLRVELAAKKLMTSRQDINRVLYSNLNIHFSRVSPGVWKRR